MSNIKYSKESLDRQKKIRDLKEAGVICYANNFHGKMDIDTIIAEKDKIKDAKELMDTGAVGEYKTAGRLMLHRGMGKLVFSKIIDHTAEIQVCFQKGNVLFNTGRPLPVSKDLTPSPSPLEERGKSEANNSVVSLSSKGEGIQGGGFQKVTSLIIAGEEKSAHKIAEKFCHVGDYIGVTGDLFLTKHGELTLFVKEFQILSKAVRPLPEKFHGVTDIETLYRQRYLDMIMNQETYDRMKLRSKFIKTLRDFYYDHDFIEIETPVLGNSASGAAAAPFITHHNDFDQEFFLRISPETALKKATVGRFERVVEFTRNFRNEGSDPSHMQEFSSIEHYAAYWNFEDNMQFTEDMFAYIFKNIPELKQQIEVKDKQGNVKTVDFSKKWERVDYVEGVKKACGIDVSEYGPENETELRKKIQEAGYTWEGIEKQATATMIDYLYKKVLRPGIVGPAFVYNYPKTMQPLARQSDTNADIVEQFQVVVNGWEVIKAYSELVDPKIQIANFDAQGDALERGDEEATSGDDDFVLAMEYGMPCQSGWGMGIERVFSLLTEQENLRDVVLFPLMKSEQPEEKVKVTNLAVALINKGNITEKWQELNTVGHLTAAYGAKEGKSLFDTETVTLKDNTEVMMNTSHAIVIKETQNNVDMTELIEQAKKEGLLVTEFTESMLKYSDDKKVEKEMKNKSRDEVNYLGVLVYGKKSVVEKVTKSFSLYE